jgi:hypothetical protein
MNYFLSQGASPLRGKSAAGAKTSGVGMDESAPAWFYSASIGRGLLAMASERFQGFTEPAVDNQGPEAKPSGKMIRYQAAMTAMRHHRTGR